MISIIIKMLNHIINSKVLFTNITENAITFNYILVIYYNSFSLKQIFE